MKLAWTGDRLTGGTARSLSFHAARRITENFRYLAAVDVLRRRPIEVTRVRAFARPLPPSEGDLLRLQRIAAANRDAPGDAEDIAFLEHRRTARGSSG